MAYNGYCKRYSIIRLRQNIFRSVTTLHGKALHIDTSFTAGLVDNIPNGQATGIVFRSLNTYPCGTTNICIDNRYSQSSPSA